MRVILLPVLLVACGQPTPRLPSITGKLNKVVFVYPVGVQSERDLYSCPENSACSVVHKRFWLPPVVERLCKCPRRHDCSWTWTEDTDNYTMTLDNRSQIKFCEQLQLPKCTIKKSALRVVTRTSATESITPRPRQILAKGNRHAEPKNVTAFCSCQDPHYWKLKPNSTRRDEETDSLHQTYFCSKLKKCAPSEFCGHVRTDTHSTFYRCSCPDGHLCISRDKSAVDVEELLFNGQSYRAFCLPVTQKHATISSLETLVKKQAQSRGEARGMGRANREGLKKTKKYGRL